MNDTRRPAGGKAPGPEVLARPREGDLVRVVTTGAIGRVVEVDSRYKTAEVDLDDGIYADFGWDEITVLPRAQA